MIDVEKLKDVRNRSYEFLTMAYWLSDNKWDVGITFAKVLDKLEWDYEDYGRIEDFLSSEGLINRWTAGGVKGTFKIEFAGIVEVERLIDEGAIHGSIITDDDGQSGETKEIELREKIIEKQEKRGEFMLHLYDACEGSSQKWVTIRPIAEAMNLEEAEAYGIEQYLEGAYLLKRISGGGWNGSVGLTDWGLQRVSKFVIVPN